MRILVCHDTTEGSARRDAIEGLITGLLQEGHHVRTTGTGWVGRVRAERAFEPDFCIDYVRDGMPVKAWLGTNAPRCRLVGTADVPAGCWGFVAAVHAERLVPPPFAPARRPAAAVVGVAGDLGALDGEVERIQLEMVDPALLDAVLRGCDVAALTAATSHAVTVAALAAGCPVVAVAGLGLVNAQNARIVAADADLGAAIGVLLDDPDLRRRLEAAASADFTRHGVTWQGQAREIVTRFAT